MRAASDISRASQIAHLPPVPPFRAGMVGISGRLVGIQYLRAWAALSVCLFHVGLQFGVHLPLANSSIDLFFVISGFLMVVIAADGRGAGAFMRDRFARIVPIYWLATTVIVVLLKIGSHAQLPARWVWASYAFIPARGPTGQIWTALAPGWTLNFEMAFYALFAMLLWIRGVVARVAALSLILVMSVVVGLIVHPHGAVPATYTRPIILEFAMGAWIGVYWLSGRTWSRVWGWPTIALAVALLLGALNWDGGDARRALVFGPAYSLLLMTMLKYERDGAVPYNRFGEWIGDASYSIYVWHVVIITVMLKVSKLLRMPEWAAIPALIVTALAGSLVAYQLIERPIMRWFRRRRDSRRAGVATGERK